MDRRQFLVRSAATCGALITPRFVREALGYIEHHDEPLLIPPADFATQTLYATTGSSRYCLYLGHPEQWPPSWTWREFAADQGYCTQREALEYLRDSWRNDTPIMQLRSVLDEKVDESVMLEWWGMTNAPNTLAYRYLESLDLGPEFGSDRRGQGDIHFIEGYCPGNNTIMVEVGDELSLSLLQARLNELNENTAIELINDY